MMRTILILGGLLGLTFPAPAQEVQAKLGKHLTIGIDLGGRHQPACPPILPAPAGEWREITERVWVPGECRQVCHPAVWGWKCDPCGRRVWTILRPAWTETIHEPGRWECRTRRVWVPYPSCGTGPVRHGGSHRGRR